MSSPRVTDSRFLLFSCAGGNNVGQLSNCAVSSLVKDGFGIMGCLAAILAGQAPSQPAASDHSPATVVVDGCDKRCGYQALKQANINCTHHLVVTDLGIEIDLAPVFTADELELVINGIMACCAEYSSTAVRGGCMCGL